MIRLLKVRVNCAICGDDCARWELKSSVPERSGHWNQLAGRVGWRAMQQHADLHMAVDGKWAPMLEVAAFVEVTVNDKVVSSIYTGRGPR